MPNRSSFISAYSRHSARTSQPRQTFLASRVEPPFSGKNASGSVCAHRARSCQPLSSSGSSMSGTPRPWRCLLDPGRHRRARECAGHRMTLVELHARRYSSSSRPVIFSRTEDLFAACRGPSDCRAMDWTRHARSSSRPAASAPPGSCAACSPRRARLRGRRGHRHRQHRRRHHAVRPARLPRPGHRDVHPRRRHPRGAGLGPRRRDLRGQGGARGVRRGAGLVRPRRPRHRHPRRAHPDARRRLPAQRR